VGVSGLLSFCVILQAILADRCGSPFLLLANLCGFLLCKYFRMSSRLTRNSQSAALDALSVAVSAEPSCASVIADPAANPLGPSAAAPRAVAAVGVQQDQPSPAFLATVVQAVKDALAADRAPACSVPSASSQPSPATMLGGVPVSSSNLASQASAFLTSGTGFLPTSVSSASQGRPSYVVPSFISTFLISSPAVSLPSCAFGTSSSASVSSLSSLPALQQPFVVGPGFSPIWWAKSSLANSST